MKYVFSTHPVLNTQEFGIFPACAQQGTFQSSRTN